MNKKRLYLAGIIVLILVLISAGIYAAEDDLGTSYYFRGTSTRNYVKFGRNSSDQDMYWRIIRINEDGTVRMIYDSTVGSGVGL